MDFSGLAAIYPEILIYNRSDQIVQVENRDSTPTNIPPKGFCTVPLAEIAALPPAYQITFIDPSFEELNATDFPLYDRDTTTPPPPIETGPELSGNDLITIQRDNRPIVVTLEQLSAYLAVDSSSLLALITGGADDLSALETAAKTNLVAAINEVHEQLVNLEVGNNPTFLFAQNQASATWKITHNLGKFPSVTLVDSAGDLFDADLQYLDSNNIVVRMISPTAGTAYLN